MSGYAFRHALTYGAETWHGSRGWALEAQEHIFEVTPKIKGHSEVNLLRNALWLQNLVERTPDQTLTHCWVKGHAGQLGSTIGQFS